MGNEEERFIRSNCGRVMSLYHGAVTPVRVGCELSQEIRVQVAAVTTQILDFCYQDRLTTQILDFCYQESVLLLLFFCNCSGECKRRLE